MQIDLDIAALRIEALAGRGISNLLDHVACNSSVINFCCGSNFAEDVN